MSEPTGSLVLPGLPNNHCKLSHLWRLPSTLERDLYHETDPIQDTYITLLLLSSITAIKSVSGAAGGLDPWLQGSLPICKSAT